MPRRVGQIVLQVAREARVARLLGKRGATIVSPENFMLYTPMLPEAASGTLEPRHVVVPLREELDRIRELLNEIEGKKA